MHRTNGCPQSYHFFPYPQTQNMGSKTFIALAINKRDNRVTNIINSLSAHKDSFIVYLYFSQKLFLTILII